MKRSPWIVALALLALVRSASAEVIRDPQPAMTWDALLACKLVVVARYDSHKPGTLTIKVERVLRSPAEDPVQAGDLIDVSLLHWWTVETGPVGFDAMLQNAQGDGLPRLCYKTQMMNPGPLVPDPVLEKGQSGIFFLPARHAVLERALQVQPVAQAEGWQQALAAAPIDLSFRLAQMLNQKLRSDAIAEFKTTRDRKVITQLIDTIVAGSPWGYRSTTLFQASQPLELLIALGDKNGDVYDAARAKLEAALKSQPPWPGYYLAYVMAQVDPDRALKELKAWIKNPPQPEYKKMAVAALGWVGTEESMNLAIDMIADKDNGVSENALTSVRNQIRNCSSPGPAFTREQYARLWGLAKKRLAGSTPPAHLSDDVRNDYKLLVDKELNADKPPQ